jgi:hypothetical protein
MILAIARSVPERIASCKIHACKNCSGMEIVTRKMCVQEACQEKNALAWKELREAKYMPRIKCSGTQRMRYARSVPAILAHSRSMPAQDLRWKPHNLRLVVRLRRKSRDE